MYLSSYNTLFDFTNLIFLRNYSFRIYVFKIALHHPLN